MPAKVYRDGAWQFLLHDGSTVAQAVTARTTGPVVPSAAVDVIDWIGSDTTRAQVALEVELARPAPRPSVRARISRVLGAPVVPDKPATTQRDPARRSDAPGATQGPSRQDSRDA